MEHAEAMNGAYKSFRVDGRGKTDVDSYVELVRPEVQKLLEEQVRVLDAAKVQMHLWVMWKKKERLLIRLDDGEMESWSDKEKQTWLESNGTHETKVDKVFNGDHSRERCRGNFEKHVRAYQDSSRTSCATYKRLHPGSHHALGH